MRHFIFLKYIQVVVASFILAACAAVGPDYDPPNPKTPAKWHVEPQDGLTAGTLEIQFLSGWWSALDDPPFAIDEYRIVRKSRSEKSGGPGAGSPCPPGYPTSRSVPVTGCCRIQVRKPPGAPGCGHPIIQPVLMPLGNGCFRWKAAGRGSLRSQPPDERCGPIWHAIVSLAAEMALNYIDVSTLQKRRQCCRRGQP